MGPRLRGDDEVCNFLAYGQGGADVLFFGTSAPVSF
jgi:hypothetical protein